MSFLTEVKSFIRRRISVESNSVKTDNRAFIRLARKRECSILIKRFPELQIFGFEVTENNARDLLKFYRLYIPSFYPPSKGAHLRNLLLQLSENTKDSKLKKKAEIEIAKSNLAEGIPEQAKILSNDENFKEAWRNEITKSDEAYGVQYGQVEWNKPSRGKSLVLYFSSNMLNLRDKKILHFAPEIELEAFFRENENSLNIDYQTADAFVDSDIQTDITCLDNINDNEYDLCICHRVLEHITDDLSAMQQISRKLKIGGMLQMSVPQSVHVEKTREWVIEDLTHYYHVRHYGQDLSERLEDAGFIVSVEEWLLKQDRKLLLDYNAIPMRIYNCKKE